jgi:prepilin-type N-terminal cleavage/methylation domain-containing protein
MKRNGLTLIELLVVAAILLILGIFLMCCVPGCAAMMYGYEY